MSCRSLLVSGCVGHLGCCGGPLSLPCVLPLSVYALCLASLPCVLPLCLVSCLSLPCVLPLSALCLAVWGTVRVLCWASLLLPRVLPRSALCLAVWNSVGALWWASLSLCLVSCVWGTVRAVCWASLCLVSGLQTEVRFGVTVGTLICIIATWNLISIS